MESLILIVLIAIGVLIFFMVRFSKRLKENDEVIKVLTRRLEKLEKLRSQDMVSHSIQMTEQQNKGVTIDLDKKKEPGEITPEKKRPQTTFDSIDTGKVILEKSETAFDKVEIDSVEVEKSSLTGEDKPDLEPESKTGPVEEIKEDETKEETVLPVSEEVTETEKSRAEEASTGQQEGPAGEIEPVEKSEQPVEEKEEEIKEEPEKAHARQKSTSTIRMTPPVQKRVKKSFEKPEFWKKIEERFLENWIGILGAITLVIGVSITTVYTAVIWDFAFYRFALIVGFSAILTILFFVLKRFDYWLQLSLWLRSAAGAVFLLACIGAGGIPGIQFIDGIPALLLLLLGVGVNLFLAFIGSRQELASLHVLLSLVSIGFASTAPGPDYLPILCLVLATLITLFGIFLTFRERWEYHLLFTITCFFIFLLYHRIALWDMSHFHKLAGIGATLAGLSGALLIHYRKVYKSEKFEKKPFIVHMAAWIYLGLALLAYRPGAKLVAIPIALSALLIFFIARQAKKRGIRWLYITDTLIGQLTAFIGVTALFMVDIHAVTIMGVLFLEFLIFTVVMRLENEPKLYRLGTFLQNILSVVLAFTAFVTISRSSTAPALQFSFITAFCGAAWAAFRLYTLKKNDPLLDPEVSNPGPAKLAVFHKISLGASALLVLLSLVLLLLHNLNIVTGFNGTYLLLTGTVLFLSQRNRFKERILFLADTTYALFTSYLVAALMYRYEVHIFHIVFAMFIISGFVRFIMGSLDEKQFHRAAGFIKNVLSIALAGLAFIMIDPDNYRELYNAAFFLGLGTAFTLLYKLYELRKKSLSFNEDNQDNQPGTAEMGRDTFYYKILLAGVSLLSAVSLLFFLLYETFPFIAGLRGEYLLLLSALPFLAVREGFKREDFSLVDKGAALAAMYICALLLLRWNVHFFHVIFICQLISTAGVCITRLVRDRTYYPVSQLIANLLTLMLPVIGFIAFSTSGSPMIYNAAFILGLSGFITMAAHLFILKTPADGFDVENHRLSLDKRFLFSQIYAGACLVLALAGLILYIRFPGSDFIANLRGEFILFVPALASIFARQRFIKKMLFKIDSSAVLLTAYLITLLLLLNDVPVFYIFMLMFGETLLYSLYLRVLKEKTLFTAASFTANLFLGLICITAFIIFIDGYNVLKMYRYSLFILGAAAASAFLNALLLFWYSPGFDAYRGTLSKTKRLIYHLAGGAACLAGFIVLLILMSLSAKSAFVQKIEPFYILYGVSLAALFIRPQVPGYSLKTGLGFFAQVVSYVLALSLISSGSGYVLIFSLCFISTILFTMPHIYSGSKELFTLENYLIFIVTLLQILMFCLPLLTGETYVTLFKDAAILFVSLTALVGYMVFSYGKMDLKAVIGPGVEIKKDDTDSFTILTGFELLGFSAAAILTAIHLILINDLPWTKSINSEYLLLLPAAALLFIRNKFQFKGLGIGLLISLFICCMAAWINIRIREIYGLQAVIYSLPLFVLSLLSIYFSKIKNSKGATHLTWYGIYLFFIHLSFTVYFAAINWTDLFLGPFWLFSSIFLLEGASALRRKAGDKVFSWGKPDLHLIVTGYAMLTSFLIRHILVHLQAGEHIGILPARMLISIFGLAILVYWLFHKKPVSGDYYKLYEKIQPFLLEVTVLFLMLTAAWECEQWYPAVLPAIWAVISIVTVLLGVFGSKKLSRLQIYSLFFFWLTLFHVVFITSPLDFTMTFTTFELEWFAAVLALVLLFVYLVLFYLFADFKKMEVPRPFGFLEKFALLVDKKKHYWIYFPLFIGITLFEIWSFDRSLLTFLLSVNAAAFFIVSVIVRDNIFRYLSYVAILACMVRLVAFDLRRANTLVKGLVCIGVAALLLIMNAIYSKYKARFKSTGENISEETGEEAGKDSDETAGEEDDNRD